MLAHCFDNDPVHPFSTCDFAVMNSADVTAPNRLMNPLYPSPILTAVASPQQLQHQQQHASPSSLGHSHSASPQAKRRGGGNNDGSHAGSEADADVGVHAHRRQIAGGVVLAGVAGVERAVRHADLEARTRRVLPERGDDYGVRDAVV